MRLLSKHPSQILGIALLSTLVLPHAFAEDAKVDFQKDIWPIIEKNCIKCHREPYMKNGKMKKPKGGLRLDTAELFMKGGEDDEGKNIKIVVPGNPEKSPFYKRTTLPKGHDDIMPPKGEPLSKKETELLKNWILQGANFGSWTKAKLKDPT